MLSWLSLPLRLRAASLIVAAGVSLGGCASQMAYDSSLSPAQNQLRQANARFNQTVGEGAAAGALVGALAGAALGGRNRGQAALIGAGAGAALGTGAGYLVARNNLSRSSTEADYNNAIEQATGDAAAYRQSAEASRQIAADATAEAARLSAQYRNRQITAAQYRSGISRFQQDSDIINQQITQARQASAAMQRDASVAQGSNRNALASTAADVEASRSQLERSADTLSRALASVPQA